MREVNYAVSLAPRTDPRGFCGPAYPGPMVADLREDVREIIGCYLVYEKQRRETKAGKPFLELTLGDQTGTVTAMVWDDAERCDRAVGPDDVVGVRGKVSVYREKMQLTVSLIEPLEISDDDLATFLPASPRDRGQMMRELDAMVASVSDLPLRTLLVRCVGAKTQLGRSFRIHPAAKKHHHAYLGGLMEHSLSVAGAADRLCAHYREQGAPLDRDLLIAGALLHDIGKTRELTARRSFAYTDEGQLLGHILLGLQVILREADGIPGLRADRMLHLQHLIASHHGKYEFASPKLPQTLEALLLSFADDLDAKMNPGMRAVAGLQPGGWTPFDRGMDRSFHRPALLESAAAPVLEPVAPREFVADVIDLFRG